MNDTTVSLAYFNSYAFIDINPLRFFEKMLTILDPKDVQGYSFLRSEKIITLFFKNIEAKKLLISSLNTVDDNVILYDNVFVRHSSLVAYLKWLPIFIDVGKIVKFLNPFIHITNIKKEVLFINNKHFPSGKLKIYFTLNNGVDLDDIPHRFIIDSHKAFFSIPGRSTVCFRCNNRGHYSYNCLFGSSQKLTTDYQKCEGKEIFFSFIDLDKGIFEYDTFDSMARLKIVVDKGVDSDVFSEKPKNNLASVSDTRVNNDKEMPHLSFPYITETVNCQVLNELNNTVARTCKLNRCNFADDIKEEEEFVSLEGITNKHELSEFFDQNENKSKFKPREKNSTESKLLSYENEQITSMNLESQIQQMESDDVIKENLKDVSSLEFNWMNSTLDFGLFENNSQYFRERNLNSVIQKQLCDKDKSLSVLRYEVPMFKTHTILNKLTNPQEVRSNSFNYSSINNQQESKTNDTTIDSSPNSFDKSIDISRNNVVSDLIFHYNFQNVSTSSSLHDSESEMYDLDEYEKQTKELQILINPNLFKENATGTKNKVRTNLSKPNRKKKKKKKNKKHIVI